MGATGEATHPRGHRRSQPGLPRCHRQALEALYTLDLNLTGTQARDRPADCVRSLYLKPRQAGRPCPADPAPHPERPADVQPAAAHSDSVETTKTFLLVFFLLGPESWQQVTVDPEEENLFLPQSQCQPDRHC